MAKGFFIKLAAGNLSRSRRIYIPYFIASTVIVSIYFLVTTIIYMRTLSNIEYSTNFQILFRIGMIVMTILIFPFMLYINSFLIKRRKKELGLYGILGLEKRHVGRVILWENLILSLAALFLGILSGCVFGKLIFLLMLFALRSVASGSLFTIPWQAFVCTTVLFAAIFLVTTLYNLLHVRLASPIDLLKGERKGEKKVRGVIPLTLIGLLLLAWAYYTSLTTANALAAINKFMIAVVAVVVATYLLFTTGSQWVLNLLRKNKGFYYKPNNFVAISGMFHRMKQNSAGLATICILATMVLVTVSTCCSLSLGQEDILAVMYPDDVSVFVAPESSDKQIEELNSLIDRLGPENNIRIANRYAYSYLRNLAIYRDGKFSKLTDGGEFNSDIYENYLYTITIIPLEDYNENFAHEETSSDAGTQAGSETLDDNEILVMTDTDLGGLSVLSTDGVDYTVKKTVPVVGFTAGRGSVSSIHLVVRDIDAMQRLYSGLFPGEKAVLPARVIAFDVEGDREDGLSFARALREQAWSLDALKRIDDIFTNRLESYTIYGGLLFLGIFFTVLFLTATVLIIYFKQVSEGYEDKDRFEILQKVGMDDDEVKHTINKQIVIVFFLPLAGALLHLAAASHMIVRMLELFNLYNRSLTTICILVTSVLFGLSYGVVYKLTARTYYKIVKR